MKERIPTGERWERQQRFIRWGPCVGGIGFFALLPLVLGGVVVVFEISAHAGPRLDHFLGIVGLLLAVASDGLCLAGLSGRWTGGRWFLAVLVLATVAVCLIARGLHFC